MQREGNAIPDDRSDRWRQEWQQDPCLPRGLSEADDHSIRIAVDADIGPGLLGPVLAVFAARCPNVAIEIDVATPGQESTSQGFDLAVRQGLQSRKGCALRRLADLAMGLYASPAYLKRRGTPAEPAELAGHARLHGLRDPDAGAWRLSKGGEENLVPPSESAIFAENKTMMRSLLRLDIGIGALDQITAREDVRAGLLVRVLPDWRLPPIILSLLMQADPIKGRTTLLLDLLAKRVANLSPGGA